MAGYDALPVPVPDVGYDMSTSKEMLFPDEDAVIERVVLDGVAVIDDGVGGFSPSSSCCRSVVMCARRQVQSSVLEMRPSWAGYQENGSGRVEMGCRDGEEGREGHWAWTWRKSKARARMSLRIGAIDNGYLLYTVSYPVSLYRWLLPSVRKLLVVYCIQASNTLG